VKCTRSGPQGSTLDRLSANIAGMSNDPKRIVVSGYDEVANIYLERFGVSTVRQKWVRRLIDGLPAGGAHVKGPAPKPGLAASPFPRQQNRSRTLTPNQARDLLEIVEDRYDKHALIITSQVPVDRWHDLIGVPTLADARRRKGGSLARGRKFTA
jgi:hypothetical protein